MSEVETQPAQLDPSALTAQTLFAQILHGRIQSGALEKAISTKVDALIDEVAKEVFRSYGDVGKAIKDKLTAAIVPNLESIGDLPVYHEFVMNRLKFAAQNFYDQRLAEVVDAELKEVFSELPEKITLSWIVGNLAEDAKGNEDGENITLIIEDRKADYSWSKPGDWVHVYLDKEEGKASRDCEFDLHLSKNKDTGNYKILGIRCGRYKTGESLSIGRIYNLEKVIFNVYAMKGEISLDKGTDADDYDTSYERECHC